MNRKMIIFEKSNHALACTKIVIFTFIFTLHFSNSFKLCSDMSSFAVTTTITHYHQPQSPPQHPITALDVVWAPGKCFLLLMPHWLLICSNNKQQQQHRVSTRQSPSPVPPPMLRVGWWWQVDDAERGSQRGRMDATSTYRVDRVLMASSHTLMHIGQGLFLQWALHISIPIFVSTKEYNYIQIYYFRTIRLKY